MKFLNEFKEIPTKSRPKIRWWIPSTLTDEKEAEREIIMLKDAGFAGAEIAPRDVFNPATGCVEKGWGNAKWGQKVKNILKIAKKYDFEIDLMIMTSSPIMLDIIDDVDDPVQGARLELDGAYIDGITRDNPFNGSLPLNDEAIEDAEKVNGTCVLYAVTVAKYLDKEKRILSFESARELNIDKDVIKTGENSLSYHAQFVPEDDGEYVLFAWWQHPSGQNILGIPQLDYLGKYGTKRFIKYHEDEFLPSLGEMRDYVTSYFIDSLEWVSHLDIVADFRNTFKEKRGFDITKYLPAIYEKDQFGCFSMPRPDFSFDKHSDKIINSYGEFLTELYIENHLKPLRDFCKKNGLTLRYQTSYGKFFELQQTAMYVDIPDTETLYGKDILDFYRVQSGAMHITNKNIYSIEGSAEKPGRGNGEENSGNYAQDFKRQLWHLQRAYAVGVNQVYFHGFRYRGHYNGPGNENGVLPGVHWPGYEPMDYVGGWSNSWDDRQPNWFGMRQLTDSLGRMQYVLQKGKPKVDLAIYRHCYQEKLDICDVQKLFNSSVLEQSGYSYDFLSPSHFTNFDVDYDGKSIFSDGPGYKAVIFNEQKDLPISVVKKLVSLSEQGLPIIFCGSLPCDGAFFGESEIGTDIKRLLENKNVRVCDSAENLPQILKDLNVLPDVSYRGTTKVLNTHRRADGEDYIYLYNYADADTYPEIMNAEKTKFTVNLNMSGVPYILDSWTGDIKEAKVIERRDNFVSVELELEANDSTILLVKKEPYDQIFGVDKVINYDDSFELQNWILEVESWTAGDNPLVTKKEIVKKAELKEPVFFTKIDDLQSVSGVGYYKTEFNLKKGWEEGQGAYLLADEIEDCYILKVNGQQISSNQVEPLADIGKCLKKGRNVIEITVYSTLLNAAVYYSNENGIENNGDYKDYGMNGPVKIIPYTF